MASPLSGLSALGIGLGEDSESCAQGMELWPDGVCRSGIFGAGSTKMLCGDDEYWSNTQLVCIKSSFACPEGQFPNGPGGACTTNFCSEGNEPAPGGGCQPASKCKPGQVKWSEGGVEKCGTMDEYNAYVAKVTGKTPAKTGGGYVKTTTPVVGQPAESSIPWGTSGSRRG